MALPPYGGFLAPPLFVLFCSSQSDAVVRYLIPHARRIADAPLDVVPQISWGNSVLASAYRGCARGC
jgi:hypothetical protein